MGRFDYVKYDEQAAARQAQFKKAFEELEKLIDSVLLMGRYKSMALTDLEYSYMSVGKALRDDQILRNGGAELQEERGKA